MNDFSNDSPVYAPNWSKVQELFVTEQPDGDFHKSIFTVTVPTDENLNNLAIAVTQDAQVPTNMAIREFTVDVVQPFETYDLLASVNNGKSTSMV